MSVEVNEQRLLSRIPTRQRKLAGDPERCPCTVAGQYRLRPMIAFPSPVTQKATPVWKEKSSPIARKGRETHALRLLLISQAAR
jgi:hypothetical protein